MKIKMTVIYGDDICEALKEEFGCETDDELLGVFKAVMIQSLAEEVVDPKDLSLSFEKFD